MFEKEAYEYGEEKIDLATSMRNPQIETATRQGFKDGAEFGYNKAKEEMQEQIEKMKDCLNKWYKQHNDDDYTETFYDNLLRDTEKCLWGDKRK